MKMLDRTGEVVEAMKRFLSGQFVSCSDLLLQVHSLVRSM